MTDDLIKRKDAINEIRKSIIPHDIVCASYSNLCINAIRRVPSADRPQEWIPCSERLPQYRDVVLISTFWGVRVAERDGIKEDGTDDFWYLFLNDATAHPRYVYAWMPLPEPWKGANNDRV